MKVIIFEEYGGPEVLQLKEIEKPVPKDNEVCIKVLVSTVNLTHAEAAVFPYGAIVALNLLRRANLQKGERVLINGASGGIGSQAVQLAKYFGAQVTGVCSTRRVEFVKALGADAVIDYSRDNFTTGKESYDLIFDILGRSSFIESKRVLKPNGRYLLASFKMKQLMQMFWTKIAGDKKVICTLAGDKAEGLEFITGLIEAGHMKAVIDRRFPLDQASDAHRYVESGRKKGHVVVTLTNNFD